MQFFLVHKKAFSLNLFSEIYRKIFILFCYKILYKSIDNLKKPKNQRKLLVQICTKSKEIKHLKCIHCLHLMVNFSMWRKICAIPREGQQLKKCQTWECPKLPVIWEIHQIPNFLKIIIAVRPCKLLYLKILLPRQETVWYRRLYHE